MSPWFRRFAGPAVLFLIPLGWTMSGYTNVWFAWFIWAVAGTWGSWALLTWEPVQSRLRSWFLRLRLRRALPSRELGFLDFMVGAQKLPIELASVLQRITQEMERLGIIASRVTRQVEDEWGSGRPDATSRVHQFARQTAREMSRRFRRMDRMCDDMEWVTGRLIESYNGLADFIRNQAERGNVDASLSQFRSALVEMHAATVTALATTITYRDVLTGTRGISADLTVAVDRGIATVSRLIVQQERIRDTCQSVIGVIDPLLPPAP